MKKKKKKNLPYTTQTFTVPFYQSKEISRLIWEAHSQIDWCYNEGVRQTLENDTGRFGLYNILTEKRVEYGWLNINANTHRYAVDCGRKSVEAFLESNIVKRLIPKCKRKYTPPDSLFRKKKKRDVGIQPAIGCYGHPAGRADGSWNLGGICNVVPKNDAAGIKRDQIKSFQIIETTKKITCRTLPEDCTYELHVQMHVAKPERTGGDIVGVDVGAVNMLAIHNLDKNTTVLATLPENAMRHKNDDIDKRKSVQSRRKKGGNTWKKVQRRIAKAVQKVRNRRTDFMRKTVKEEFESVGIIGVENLHPKQMARKGRGKTGLNRVIKYAALGEVLSCIEWFAEKHNKEFHKVKPHYTSTTCGACEHSDKNSRRSQSIFVCVKCGHEDHADSNAGVNIALRCAARRRPGRSSSEGRNTWCPAQLSGEASFMREPIKVLRCLQKKTRATCRRRQYRRRSAARLLLYIIP